jgi:hypothetical protein
LHELQAPEVEPIKSVQINSEKPLAVRASYFQWILTHEQFLKMPGYVQDFAQMQASCTTSAIGSQAAAAAGAQVPGDELQHIVHGMPRSYRPELPKYTVARAKTWKPGCSNSHTTGRV